MELTGKRSELKRVTETKGQNIGNYEFMAFVFHAFYRLNWCKSSDFHVKIDFYEAFDSVYELAPSS